MQLLLEHLHPCVVDVELEALQVVLNDLEQAIVLVVVGLLLLVPVLGEEHEREHLVNVRQPERTRVDSVIAVVLHDFLLDRLHNVGEETLRLLDEAVVPHLGGDEVDEVGGEENLLICGRRCGSRRRNLQVLDETKSDFVVEHVFISQDVLKLKLDVIELRKGGTRQVLPVDG